MVLASIALVCGGGLQTARAQDASAWDKGLNSAARLIAGATQKSTTGVWLRAGIEIRLKAGWHTYWRYPGDSGVPPTFNFAGSQNVKGVTVLWPAPERFADGAGGQSIGYFDHVVFPLHITASNPAKPSSLHVKLGYAVCRDICLPAEADLELAPSGNSGAEEATLVAAETRVPQRVPLGAVARLSIRSVHREDEGGYDHVIVEIAAPERTPVDLFVEGPTPDWALPLPEPSSPTLGSASGVRRFTFDLDGTSAGARAEGATLTFTAVSPDDAIEVIAHPE